MFLNGYFSKGYALLTLLFLSQTSYGDNLPHPPSNPEPTHIHFQAEASEKVAGNTMQTTLRLEVKNKLPALAAKELNKRLQESMQSLRNQQALHIETNQYLTHQVFDEKGRPKEWQVSVELILSSQQWNILEEHVSALQNKGWLFSGVSFEVSPEQAKAAQKRLTERALSEWTEQAERIAKQLQLKKWHIGNLEISSPSSPMPPRLYKVSRMAAMAEAAPVAPDMAGADTSINIIVNGELVAE